MDRACARAARTGQRFYLYGGRNQGALAQLGRVPAPAPPGPEDRRRLRAAVPRRSPTPRTRRSPPTSTAPARRSCGSASACPSRRSGWPDELRLRRAVLVGVGAAFDFHAGLVPQAPGGLPRVGLEWLFRLMQEPRRLWRRYLRYNPQPRPRRTRRGGRRRRPRRCWLRCRTTAVPSRRRCPPPRSPPHPGRAAPGRPSPRRPRWRRARPGAVRSGRRGASVVRAREVSKREMRRGAAELTVAPLAGWWGRRSGALDGRDVELEDDLVGDQEATGLQGGVPGQTPVLAVDRGLALEACAKVAEGVASRAGVLEVDAEGLGGALDGQVAGDGPVAAVALRRRWRRR